MNFKSLLVTLCDKAMSSSMSSNDDPLMENSLVIKSPCNTKVIREVYDGINSQDRFECELESALEEKVDYIVIEPSKLGDYN